MTKSLLSAFIALASFLALTTGCGGGGGGGSGGGAAEGTSTTSNMKLAKTKAEIVCDATSKDFIFYIPSETIFYSCDGAALTAIDLKGKDGAAGAAGAAGSDNHIIKTVSCIGTISDTDSDPFWNGISLSWASSITKFGDVFATATISGLESYNVSGANFYSASQNGALSGGVILSVDNSNFFEVKYDTTLANITAVVTSSNGHSDSFANVNACTVLTYP